MDNAVSPLASMREESSATHLEEVDLELGLWMRAHALVSQLAHEEHAVGPPAPFAPENS
jgi:hypothetical protein